MHMRDEICPARGMMPLYQYSFIIFIGLLLFRLEAPETSYAQTFSCERITEIPKIECEALVDLYMSTDGPNWTVKDGWLETETPCNWHGITCLEYTNYIFGIELINNRLKGSLPSSLNQIKNLRDLNLSFNTLQGELPETLWELKYFRNLNISMNQLIGELPSDIGNLTNILELDLSSNQLSGPLPNEIGNLARLIFLKLNDNKLDGELPKALGNLNLKELELQRNLFDGSLPAELGNIPSIKKLKLNSNKFTGPLPHSFGNFIRLEELYLQDNQLTGEIPDELGNLPNLYYLNISNNNLTGTFPISLTNLPRVVRLKSHHNQLTGELPSEIGMMKNLRNLELQHNNLSGTLPNFENMQLSGYVDVSFNQFRGSLPPLILNPSPYSKATFILHHNQFSDTLPPQPGVFSNCDSVVDMPPMECEALLAFYEKTNGDSWWNSSGWLQTDIPCDWHGIACDQQGHVIQLSLTYNQLSGSLAAELGNLTYLEYLDVSRNTVTGNIPSELGHLDHIQKLFMSNNKFSGSIPSSLGNLSTLQILSLNSNQLTGTLPKELGLLNNLQRLHLDYNRLSGFLPSELGNLTNLEYLTLSNNQFSGPIPSEFGKFTRLRSLDLSRNQLSGELPSELGNLSNLVSLTINVNPSLTSEIPLEIGMLENLTTLSLEDNQLYGEIPPELGQMANLVHLQLAGNQLEGSVPPELANLKSLWSLDLSRNLLSGQLPSEIGGLDRLQGLDLKYNQFTGKLPPELGNLRDLKQLFISYTDFERQLPASLMKLDLDKFEFFATDVCVPPDSIFQNWLSQIPSLSKNTNICSDLILRLDPGSSMDALESFLTTNHVRYTPLFDSNNGNIPLKKALGIINSYYIESSSQSDPEILRRQFAVLPDVEECRHNQKLEFDQQDFSASHRDEWFQNLSPLELGELFSWQRFDFPDTPLVGVIDNFRSLRTPDGLGNSDEPYATHGVFVAKIAGEGRENVILFDVTFEDQPYAKFDSVFKAIELIVDNVIDEELTGAVINLSLSAPLVSLGGTLEERQHNIMLFQRWIQYAYLSGVPVVTSMGNYNWDVPHYPAAFPETIAVGGSDRDFQRWTDQLNSFGSNFGEHLEFLELSSGPEEEAKAGTSFSTARVTKTIASLLKILLTKEPNISAEALQQKLRWLLEITALDGVGALAEDTPGRDPYYGWGVVDAAASAACAEHGKVLVRPESLDFGTLKVGESALLPVTLTNCSSEASFVLEDGQLIGGLRQNSAEEFELVSFPEGVTLQSGKTYSFTVEFLPQNIGGKEALLRFSASSSNPEDSEKQYFEIALYGNALSSGFTGLVGHPQMADFGDVHVENTGKVLVTITNYQQEPVTLGGAAIQELDPNSGFQIKNYTAGQTLASGDSMQFELLFNPLTSGLKHAFLSIPRSDKPNETFEIPLYGRAIDPQQALETGSILPDTDIFPGDSTQFRQQADNLMQKGIELYGQGEYWQAQERFVQAQTLYALAREDRGEARALSASGMTYVSVGRFEQSLTSLLQAQEIYNSLYLREQKAEDRLQEGILLNKIGMNYTRLGQHLNALRVFNEVLAIERELERRQDEGRTLMNIGVVYLNQGRLQQAKSYFDEGLIVAEEIDDVEGQAKSLANLGTICCREETYPQAFERYTTALDFIRQLEKAEVEESSLLLQIGDVHKLEQRYPEALKSYQEALSIFRSIQYSKGEISALINIAGLYRVQNKDTEALAFYQDALDRCRESRNAVTEIVILEEMLELYKNGDDLSLQAATLNQLAEVYNYLRRYDEALDVLMQAMLIQGALSQDRDLKDAVAESALDDEEGLSFSFLLGGEVFLRKGEYEKAIQLLVLALEAQGAENSWFDGERLRLNLAEAYLKLGLYAESELELEQLSESSYALMLLGELLAAQGEPDEALSKLERAFEGFETAEAYEDTGRVLLDMAGLSVQAGNYSKARTSFEKALLNYRMDGELKGEAIALTRLGDLQQETEASDYYQQALELYRSLDDREGQLEVLHRMAAIQGNQSQDAVTVGLDLAKAYISRGDYEEALAALEQLDLSQSSPALQAEVLLQLGISYHLQQDYQAAEGYFRQGLAFFSEEAVTTVKAELTMKLGENLFRQALNAAPPDFEETMTFYHQALALYEQLGDLQGQGTTLMRIGEVYLKQGDYNAAIESYNQAVSLLAQVDDHYNLVLAYMNLGEAYDAEGLYWDALEAYRRALGIMHDTGSFLFADYLHTSKEVRQAIQIIHSPDPIANTANIQRHLAEDYIQTEQFTEAAEALEEAAQEYEVQGDDEEAVESYEDLQELHEEQGNTDEAIEALEETLDIQRENNDYDGLEDTVEKIEELAPDYARRTVSGLEGWDDDDDDETRANDESDSSIVPPESGTEKKASLKGGEHLRSVEPERSVRESTPPKSLENLREKPEEEQLEKADSQDISANLQERRSRPTTAAQPRASPAELQRKAETFNDIGLVHLRNGNFHKAGSYFLSAQRIQNASGDEQGKALTLNNRATLRYMLGQFEEAGELYLEALDLMRKFQDIDGETQVMNQLALLYYRRGQYEETEQNLSLAERYYAEALKRFQEALALSHGLEEHAIQGTLLNNRALLYYQLMLFYRKAGYAATETAEAQGCYQHAFRMYQLALKSYQESLEIICEFGGRAGESATLHNFGKLYAVLELDSEALDYFWQALELEQATSNYIDWARTLSDIGYIYERRGKRIIGDLRDSSDLTGFKNLSGLARSWKTFTQGAFAMQQALGFYQQAIDIQESLRTKARLEEFKISFAEESANVYQQSVLLLMAMNSPELAFNMTERARARAFLDTVGTVRPDMLKGLPTRTAERVPALRKEIQRVYRALRHEQEQPLFVDNREKIDRLQADLDHLEAQYDELLMEMKLTHPKYASLLSVDPLMLQEVQSVLGAEESLISYFVTPQKLLTFVLKQHSFNSVELSLNADELYQEIAGLRKSDDKQEPQNERLAKLHGWLIESVASHLDSSRLRIAPHGMLHYLPFAALYDGERYLNDQYQLSTIPSGSVLQFLPEAAQGVPNNAFVIANEGYPPLKYAESEAKAVAELYQSSSAIGEKATIAAFQDAADKAGMIHFAGHAGLDRRTPAASGLLLDDGYLTIQDIYTLDLSRSELVVLSACNTNIGPQSRGDDTIALNRAVLSAGASAVVASLWSVNDEAASQLMLAFHENLQQGLTKAEALRRAQIETRKDFPNPKYWAAFVLTGAAGN